MKRLLPVLIAILAISSICGQITYKTELSPQRNDTKEKVSSGLYRLVDISADNVLFSGQTTHFSEISFKIETLYRDDGELRLSAEEEQILIIKEGEATVKLGQETKTIGPNGVFFLLPHEEGTISSESPATRYYRMVYTIANPPDLKETNPDISSFIIDYDDLEFHESSKGGSRKYFNRSTVMCPYYEMHVTTLNPGMQSHNPHTHEAAEIILIIEGETEEEIDGKNYRGKKGDVYFLASNIPHAIRNIGKKPCQYFAFQWGELK